MKTNRKKTTKILIIVFAVALLIEIGYAVLSSTLKINGNTKINQARWDVHFENVQVTEESVTPTAAATIDAGKTIVTYEVALTNPGDFYEFTVDAVNAGTIDAMVSAVNNTELTADQQKYLDYSVIYSDGLAIEANQLLAANKTDTLKVRVEFKTDIQPSDLPTSPETLTLEFEVVYVQADSTAVAIVHNAVCRRATTLHTEICNDGSCTSGGYSQGDTITYGSLGTAGTLAEGDAFDCDVNGDKIFDAATERFYYVNSLSSDSNYAVLAYYNNVAAGAPNNTETFAYDSSATPMMNGPVTASEQLPTTAQWKNVSLASTTRKITDGYGTILEFSYAGKAARILTTADTTSTLDEGALDDQQYLMENTKYANSSFAYGYWLETLHEADETDAFRIDGNRRSADNRYNSSPNASTSDMFGVRPAIEVPKDKIAY